MTPDRLILRPDTSPPAVPPNGLPALDEVIADGAIHIERMSDDTVWISITVGGVETHLLLHATTPKGRRGVLHFTKDGSL